MVGGKRCEQQTDDVSPRVQVQLLEQGFDCFLSRLVRGERRPIVITVVPRVHGVSEIGISLAQHKGRLETPVNAIKTHIHGAYDSLTHSILAALTAFAADRSQGPLDRLLVESLLHSCLRLFRGPSSHRPRKAIRTYESICLYMQENFQLALTRESVAERLHFHHGEVLDSRQFPQRQ